MSKKKIYQSSVTGKFVSKEEVKNNPAGTITQIVNVPEHRKPKEEKVTAADLPMGSEEENEELDRMLNKDRVEVTEVKIMESDNSEETDLFYIPEEEKQ